MNWTLCLDPFTGMESVNLQISLNICLLAAELLTLYVVEIQQAKSIMQNLEKILFVLIGINSALSTVLSKKL